ncbi:hypothetical protein JXB22_06855 [candidate division WOR-3 bacterium]|nr:hypothetical protein [candidate division WOR-3 bacterium]
MSTLFSKSAGSIVLLCILVSQSCQKGPVPTGQATGNIDVSADPHQLMIATDTSVVIKVKNGEFTVSLVAEYRLSGIVVCKQRFTGGWAAEIAPYDLTFSWGKITEDYVRKHISFSHSGRWYHYRYSGDCPVSNQYIIEHTSNNHIVPANENIRKAIGSVKKNRAVMLWGYLVDVRGTYKNDPYWWTTSRTRTDTSAHSCEVFYVTGVQIGYDVFE